MRAVARRLFRYPRLWRAAVSARQAMDRSAAVLAYPVNRMAAAGVGLIPGNAAHGVFHKHGFHLVRRGYYSPIPEAEDVPERYFEQESDLPGLDLNAGYALDLMDRVFPGYLTEFRESFPVQGPSPDPSQFYLINGSFMAMDAHAYYALIRHFRPGRIVEIGAGNSTLLAAAACRRNRAENKGDVSLTSIEPYPNPTIKRGFPGLTELIEKKVQAVDLATFTSLKQNDILFIDSSHVLRSGGDVQMEFGEILPRLASGVLVHIHDISLPRHYPKVYFDTQLYFNEQYLLQAFLCYNSRFEVIWPGNYLMTHYPERMIAAFPEYREMRRSFPSSEPTSFWMRTR